jgi:hypothetical protein
LLYIYNVTFRIALVERFFRTLIDKGVCKTYMKFVEPTQQSESVASVPTKTIVASSILTAPAGYIPIELSTDGRFGVPKLLHVKNFTTEFLVELSIATEELRSEKLISSLQALIWERDVRVEDWPEPLAIELLVKIYANFFTPVITSVTFPVLAEDISFLEEKGRKEEATDIASGKFAPRIDLDLRSFKSLEIDPKAKDFIRYSKKDGTFSVKMRSYTKLSDSTRIRKTMEANYRKTDEKYLKIKSDVEVRSLMLSQGIFEKLPLIGDYELAEWRAYEAEKAVFAVQLARAINLVEYNKQNVEDVSLEEKVRIVASDPNFDHNLANIVDAQAEKLKFGINPEIEVKNPITGEVCKRKFTFRLMDILQAVQLSDSSGYDVCYDD